MRKKEGPLIKQLECISQVTLSGLCSQRGMLASDDALSQEQLWSLRGEPKRGKRFQRKSE